MVERKLIALHSNLQTNCLISISEDATISDLRGLIQKEHAICFPEHGSVQVGALTVEYDQQQYRLTESLVVGQVLTKRWNKVHADLSSELLKRCSTSDTQRLSTEKNINVPKCSEEPHNQVIENVHDERQSSSEEGAVTPANDPGAQESPSLSATDNLGSHFLLNEGLHTQPRSDDTTHPQDIDIENEASKKRKKENTDFIRGLKKQCCLGTSSDAMNLDCAKSTVENTVNINGIEEGDRKALPNSEGHNGYIKYCVLPENVELAAINGLLSMSAGRYYVKQIQEDNVQVAQSDRGDFETGKDSESISPNGATQKNAEDMSNTNLDKTGPIGSEIVKERSIDKALKEVEENTAGTSTKEATKYSEEARKNLFDDSIEDHDDGIKSSKYPIRLNDHSILLVTSLSTDELMETQESEMNTQIINGILGEDGKPEPSCSEKVEQNTTLNNTEKLKTLGDTENDSHTKNHGIENQSSKSTQEYHQINNDQVDQVVIAITTHMNTISTNKKHKKKKNEKRLKRSAQEKLLLTMQQDAGKQKTVEENHAGSSVLRTEAINKSTEDGENKNHQERKLEKKKRKRNKSSGHTELINEAEKRNTAVVGALLALPANVVVKENHETVPERPKKKKKKNKKDRQKKHINEIVNIISENVEERNEDQNKARELIENDKLPEILNGNTENIDNDKLPETSKGNTENLDDIVHGWRNKEKKKSKPKAGASQHAESTSAGNDTDTLQLEESNRTNKKHQNGEFSYLSPEEGSNKENIMEKIDHLIDTQDNDTESPLDENTMTNDRGMDVFEFQGSEIGSRQDDSCSPGGQSCEKAEDRKFSNVDNDVLGSVNNNVRRSARKAVHPRSWVSVLSQRLRNPRFPKEDLETTTKGHEDEGKETEEDVHESSQINPDDMKVICPKGCGRTYSKKTSAFYRHRRNCKG